jgi:hypothetical protein
MSSSEFIARGMLSLAAGVAVALWVSVLRLRKRLTQLRSVQPPVIRRVTELEEREDGGIVAHLECGHQTLIALPSAIPCGLCSIEVNALKKMAGAK